MLIIWTHLVAVFERNSMSLTNGSCRTVALWKNFCWLTGELHLLRRKSCARFRLNFDIFLLCQVEIPDEKNTRNVYLFGKNINKPLVHFYLPLSAWNSPANVVDKFEPENLYRLHLLDGEIKVALGVCFALKS